MNDEQIHAVIARLRENLKNWDMPVVSHLAEMGRDPFKILISTLLSLRTKDETTTAATARLFSLARSPAQMLQLPEPVIIEAIYPVGFYRRKAATIHDICRELINRHQARVPDTLEELLALKGVGRKTANLVVSLGYGRPAICVDTHVHRISNRLGYVTTKTPEQTEQALRSKLPAPYWRDYNTLLVAFGQQVCRPVSPFCSRCPVYDYCDRINVGAIR
ncbi:MAG: endonuclease III [Syntrophus sp. (in: bacteria)]|nr:endonuclease III [Syntrophus sp. (in: bacteria)]